MRHTDNVITYSNENLFQIRRFNKRAALKFCFNLFVMFLIEKTTEPFKVIMGWVIVSMLYCIEASRGAGAQACDCERDRLEPRITWK